MKPGTTLPSWVPGESGFTGHKHPVIQPEITPWEITPIQRSERGNKTNETQRKIGQILGRQRKSS